MSKQVALLTNELLIKYFDTTNGGLSRIPDFPSRFTTAPYLKFGPTVLKA